MNIKKPNFSINYKDPLFLDLINITSHKIVALWAIDCVERVMPIFEEEYPSDNRPRSAIDTLKTWIDTGIFSMAIIRKASLDSHASAREVGEDSAARSVARAAGQAVATAHVKTHSLAAANYAAQAIYRASNTDTAASLVARERDWQYKHLLELEKYGSD